MRAARRGDEGYLTRHESGFSARSRRSTHCARTIVMVDGCYVTRLVRHLPDDRGEPPHYRIGIFHITADDELIFERAVGRGEATGRFVQVRDSRLDTPCAGQSGCSRRCAASSPPSIIRPGARRPRARFCRHR